MSGETGPIAVSLAIAMVIASFFAISIYNSIEIFVWIFNTFKRRSLYFWSMLIATTGILAHSIAVFLRFFNLAPNLAMCFIIVLGWWAMVTGQSVVMYSRLHLVVCDAWKIRWVRNMIIANVFLLHIPVSILFLGANSPHPEPFITAFAIYEKIQLAGFTVQESLISGLYVWEAARGLKPILAIKGAEGRKIIIHLVILFIVVILLDASLMIAQYTDHFQIQTTYKPVVYSIKLKFEFVILNELMALTRMRACDCNCSKSGTGGTFSHISNTDFVTIGGGASGGSVNQREAQQGIDGFTFDSDRRPSSYVGQLDPKTGVPTALPVITTGSTPYTLTWTPPPG